MDLFTRKQLTVWAIIILTIMNLMSLSLLWWGRIHYPSPAALPHEEQPPRAENLEFLRRELGLGSGQLGQVRSLRDHFFRSQAGIEQAIQFHRRKLMDAALASPPDTLRMRALSDTLGRLQTKLEWHRARHFQDIGNHCTSRQRQKLRSLFRGMNRMRRGGPGSQQRMDDSTRHNRRFRGQGGSGRPPAFVPMNESAE